MYLMYDVRPGIMLDALSFNANAALLQCDGYASGYKTPLSRHIKPQLTEATFEKVGAMMWQDPDSRFLPSACILGKANCKLTSTQSMAA